MTKTLEERIEGISRKKYKREGGLGKMDALIMTLKKEARGELAMITVDLAVELRDYISESLELLNFIAELQAENQALQKKLDEALAKLEIAISVIEEVSPFLSNCSVGIKEMVSEALEELNKQGVENDE